MDIIKIAEPIRSRGWARYGLAAILIIISIGGRLLLGEHFVGFPFLFAFIAVTIVAFIGGRGPAILTAIVSGLLAKYYLVPPIGTLTIDWPSGAWIVIFYSLLCTIIISLLHGMFVAYQALNRSEENLRALNTTLEQRIAERTATLETEMAERYQAQAQLRQLQKMESIGQLTGGIAHDFNNMLSVVIGSLDMARRRLNGDELEKARQSIDSAAEGAERAAALTARLLAFSRQQALAPQAIDVNKVVSGMSELLRRTLGEQITIELLQSGGLWEAFADPGELENAIVNLSVNARDAMPDGGKLIIETTNADLDDQLSAAYEDVKPGQYVMLGITDTGIGMAPEVLEHAFEPFYTTKEIGRGTGLGLSQVFGYVKQSGGHVKIYSEVGRGTTVKLYLPRQTGAPRILRDGPKKLPEIPRGSPEQTVLVVEDEPQVRQMTVDALSDLGFTVVHASDGDQALNLLVDRPQIDLLFTDVVMPGINGQQLADLVREKWPDIRVLFATGYTRGAVMNNGVLEPGVAFLPKPFTIEQLAQKVRAVLDGGGVNRPE